MLFGILLEVFIYEAKIYLVNYANLDNENTSETIIFFYSILAGFLYKIMCELEYQLAISN